MWRFYSDASELEGLLLRSHTWRGGASVFRSGANVSFYGNEPVEGVEMHMLLSRPRATVDSAERNSPPGSQCGDFTGRASWDGLLLRSHTWRGGASVFRPGANVVILPVKLS